MWQLEINNIAGILSGNAIIHSGLNVVQASNFQGKSSLIAALRTVMGSTGHYDDHPLTEGADSGSVILETEKDTFEVTLERDQGRNSLSGNPYLSDTNNQIAARLFAFLGEDNPIRTAVRNGDDLTEFLQEPLDLDAINREIDQLSRERRELKQEISQAERAADELPSVQEDVTRLEKELEQLRDEKIELEESNQGQSVKNDLGDKLSDRKSSLEDHKTQIERTEDLIERHQEKLEKKRSELEEIDEPEEVDGLADIGEKKERVDSLDAEIDLFEDLQRANKNVLDDGDLDTLTDVERTLSGDEVECWVCGNTAPKEEMEERIERINERITEFQEQKQDLETEINEHEQRKRKAAQKRQRRQDIKETIASLQDRIAEQQSSLETHREQKANLEDEVAELEEELTEIEEDYSEELTEVKTEIRTKEKELERKRDHLEDLEDQKVDLKHLREKKQKLDDEIEDLRNKKNETQRAIKDEFDKAIGDIIDRYAPGFEQARFDVKTNNKGDIEEFELHIAREGRETTVDALSEGEVELIGVAVALAGYRVYNVDERVPLILIDGISQLASEHLQSLTEYLENTADILVTTAYPEAGEFGGAVISPEDWAVVSDENVVGT